MLDKIIQFFKNLRKRKLAPGEEIISANDSLFLEPIPDIPEGYDSNKKTIVRLVGKKRVTKPYQVSGIEDVASKNNWKAWVYLAPVVVLISVFLLYPLINTIFISFAKDYNYATGQFSGFTLDNFGIIFGLVKVNGGQEVNFVKYAIPNTLILTFVTVPIEIIIALTISVALNSIKWFQKFIQTVFFLPYVTNAVAVGLVFSVIFDNQGIINFITGSNITWIYGANRWVAMIPLTIYIIWSSMPFKILIFLSGLQGIDKQYYQAAQIDACPKWKVLTRITFPLLSPQILYIMITSFISAFKQYTAVVAMFGGPGTLGKNSVIPDMETIVYYVYDNVEKGFTSRAGAAGVFLFVVILAFTFIQFGVSKKRVYY
ncbi:MAG TPA: sugar ABC transporter permease [Bacilli bacterium]|nr:sugar ABC transporter permease [Bacilli bacterium]